MSAALAYYTIFSLAPMLIVIISLCDVFLGKQAIEGKVYGEIASFVGPAAAVQIQEIIRNASISKNTGLASTIGIISLILAATGIFTQIQDSINFIWRLRAKPKKGWLKLLVNRGLSFSILVSLGFVLLVSLIVNAILDAFSQRLVSIFSAGGSVCGVWCKPAAYVYHNQFFIRHYFQSIARCKNSVERCAHRRIYNRHTFYVRKIRH